MNSEAQWDASSLPDPRDALARVLEMVNHTSIGLVLNLDLRCGLVESRPSMVPAGEQDGEPGVAQIASATSSLLSSTDSREFDIRLAHLMHIRARYLLNESETGLNDFIPISRTAADNKDSPEFLFQLPSRRTIHGSPSRNRLDKADYRLTSSGGRIMIDQFDSPEELLCNVWRPMMTYLNDINRLNPGFNSTSKSFNTNPLKPMSPKEELDAWIAGANSIRLAQGTGVPSKTTEATTYLVWQHTDIDRALILISHSVKPILTTLQFGQIYKEFAKEAAQRGKKDTMFSKKADFFDALAAEMGDRIPQGQLFRNDRANVLGSGFQQSRSPLELAVVWKNNRFVSSASAWTYTSDLWNEPSFNVIGRKLMAAYFLYPSRLYRSPKARLAMTAMSQIAMAVLLWLNSHIISTVPDAFDKQEHNATFFALYLFAAGLVLEEAKEIFHAVKDEVSGPKMSLLAWIRAFPPGMYRYLTLDPWNVVDLSSSILFIVALIFRLLGDEDNVFYTFALTLIPTFIRPLYILEFHESLGPLIRSIYNMAADVLSFLAMWSVVLLSFAIAFSLLFFDVPDPESGGPGRFVTYRDSMLTLFSASLGDFDFSAHKMDGRDTRNAIGTALLIIHLAVVHVLGLNLLIAVMSSVYERFRDNSIEQYRFGSVRTILRFANAVQDSEIPTPFNLLQLGLATVIASPIAAGLVCCADKGSQRTCCRRYIRLRAGLVSAGTDLLVLCVGWTLFFPFVLFSIPVILRDVQLSCSRTCRKKRWQSKQEDAAVNGEGEAESSLRRGSVGIALSLGLKQNNAQAFENLTFKTFRRNLNAYCHFCLCDRPVRANKLKLYWPPVKNRRHDTTGSARRMGLLDGRSVGPLALELIRLKLMAMVKMMAGIYEAQGVEFEGVWSQQRRNYIPVAKELVSEDPGAAMSKLLKLCGMENWATSGIGDAVSSDRLAKDLTEDFADLLTIGHGMIDLQVADLPNTPGLEYLFVNVARVAKFKGRIGVRRLESVMKIKPLHQAGHMVTGSFVLMHLLPSEISLGIPQDINQRGLLSAVKNLHTLGGELWERFLFRGHLTSSQQVFGLSKKSDLVDAAIQLHGNPFARYTHKAWLLEEFQDCCRWDVDKDFVEQTVPHKLIHEIFQPMYDEGDDDEDGDDGEEEAFRETGKFTF